MNEMGSNGGWIQPDDFTTPNIPFGSRRWNDIGGDGLVRSVCVCVCVSQSPNEFSDTQYTGTSDSDRENDSIGSI